LNRIVPVNPAAGVSVTFPVAWSMATLRFAGTVVKSVFGSSLALRTANVTVSPSTSVNGTVNDTGDPDVAVRVAGNWASLRNGRLLLPSSIPVTVNVTGADAVGSASCGVTVMSAGPEYPAVGESLRTAFTVSVMTDAPVIVTGLTGRLFSPLTVVVVVLMILA
jgi:hypothetical protein